MHLLACRHCRRYVDQMAQTLRLLSAAVADPPEPPLEAQIAAQLVALSRTGVTTGQTRNGSAPGD